jgi:hypothetical protein
MPLPPGALAAKEHVVEPASEPENQATAAAPPPSSPQRTALAAALRNAGMTAEQAEAVVAALEDFLRG